MDISEAINLSQSAFFYIGKSENFENYILCLVDKVMYYTNIRYWMADASNNHFISSLKSKLSGLYIAYKLK